MADSNSMEEFKLTDFPPEILEKFLPDLNPKTISEMKLVCRKFFHVFNSDRYFKPYLVYQEEDYESDLKFSSPAKGIKEIVQRINNGVYGKWEGYLKLQNAHLENLRCGRFDCFDVVKVKGPELDDYFEGSDAENGQWLVCKCLGKIFFVNLATKQELIISTSDYSHVSSVHFKHGIVILAGIHDMKYSVYKLTNQEGEHIRTRRVHKIQHIRTSPWPDAAYPPGMDRRYNVKFLIGSIPNNMLMSFYAFIGGNCTMCIHVVVLDVETGRATHACHIGETHFTGLSEFVMPSSSIFHVRFGDDDKHVFKSFKLLPSPDKGLGEVKCVFNLDLFPDPLGDLDTSFLNPRSLVWAYGTGGFVLKMSGAEFEKHARPFSIPAGSHVVGFLLPDIVLTTSEPIDGLALGIHRAATTQLEVCARRSNGNPLFVWNLPWLALDFSHHFFRFDQWIYPARKVVLSEARKPNYTFKVHYF